jgi:LCP family protein required for cell wall assembly
VGWSRLRRIFLATVLVLGLVIALIGVAGLLLFRRYDTAVVRGNLLAPSARADVHHADVKGPLNLLLVGSDYRTWNPDGGQRSDTIIIAHITAALDHVYLISVPRDLRVEIPPLPSLNFGGDLTKINAAFEYGRGGIGGAQLVSATLTKLIGIRFDGAAVIDFSGLEQAVDILGGVQLCVDTQVVSIHTHKVFEPGCRLMSSTDTLDYLRQRDFPDGDFTRQRHQQQFLKAFFQRALDGNNPVKLDALLRAVAATMIVDTGESSLPDLAFALRELRPTDLTGIRIPYYTDMIDKLSFVIASSDAPPLFAAVRTDTLATWVDAHAEWVNKI